MSENQPATPPTEKPSVADKMYPDQGSKETPAVTPPTAKVEDVKAGEVPPAKPADGEKPKEGSAPEVKPEVPAKYDLKLPKDSPLSQAQLEAVSSYAKEKGLTNEQAQEVLDRDSIVATNILKEQQTQFDATLETWKTAIRNDKEFGGSHLNESLILAKSVVDRFASPELKAELDATGYGNHPELMRFLVRIGKASDNAKLVQPGAPQVPVKTSVAERFYPSTKN